MAKRWRNNGGGTERELLGSEWVEDIIREANEEEGHMLPGSRAREEGADDAGAEKDLEPRGLHGRRLDERRRAAKRSFKPTGTGE